MQQFPPNSSNPVQTPGGKEVSSIRVVQSCGCGYPKLYVRYKGQTNYVPLKIGNGQFVVGNNRYVDNFCNHRVNDGVLTINGTGMASGTGTFTANQGSNSTININVPANLSAYTNDAGFLNATPGWNDTVQINNTATVPLWITASAPDDAPGTDYSRGVLNIANTATGYSNYLTLSKGNLENGNLRILTGTNSSTLYAPRLSAYSIVTAVNQGSFLQIDLNGKNALSANEAALLICVSGAKGTASVSGGDLFRINNGSQIVAASNRFSIDYAGNVKVPILSGTSARMVTADANGILGVAPIPAFIDTNIGTSDLTIPGGVNRKLNIAGGIGTFQIVGSSTISVGAGGGDPSIRLISLADLILSAGNNDGYSTQLSTSLLTDNRQHLFPDASGTLALISDIPTVLKGTYAVAATSVPPNGQIRLGTTMITGASATNMAVTVSQPANAIIYKAIVSSTNTVTIYAINPTTAAITTTVETININVQ